MSPRTATIWTFAITSVALFMTTLDNLVVTTALPVIRDDLHAEPERPRVDGQRLHVDLRRAADHRRRARRPLRAAPDVRDRARDLHRRLGRRGTGAEHRRADRRACAPGPRRGDRDAAHADDPERRRPGRAPRARARRLGRHQRPGRRDRPARRRRGRPGHLLAVDLLAQRADRARPDPARAHCACARAAARTMRSTCPGLALASLGLFGLVWGLVRGNQVGWASAEIVGAIVRRPARSGAVRALGAPRPGADAAAALLPQPDLHCRERRLAADVLRDVRLDLPPGAVLPDRPGLHAAPGRAADPAVDGDADLRRPDRRSALRPDRRAPADGRSGSGCRRPGSRGSRASRRRRRPTASSSCRSSSRVSGWRCTSRRSRTSSSRPCGRRRRDRPQAPTTRSASSAASSASPCSPRSSPTTVATAPASTSSTGSSRRSTSAPRSSPRARWPRSGSSARRIDTREYESVAEAA